MTAKLICTVAGSGRLRGVVSVALTALLPEGESALGPVSNCVLCDGNSVAVTMPPAQLNLAWNVYGTDPGYGPIGPWILRRSVFESDLPVNRSFVLDWKPDKNARLAPLESPYEFDWSRGRYLPELFDLTRPLHLLAGDVLERIGRRNNVIFGPNSRADVEQLIRQLRSDKYGQSR